jgi:hypothetical protein
MPLFKKGTRWGLTSSQITIDDMKDGIVDTDISSVSANDDTIPSSKAAKFYIDTGLAAQDSFSELTDTTISSPPTDNNHLQWDGSTSRWVNREFIDFKKITSPTEPAAEEGRLFVKEIDDNNNALAVRIKKAGLTGSSMPVVELTSPGCVCECGSTDGAKDPTFDFKQGIIIVELYCGHSYEMDIPNLRRIN